MKRILIVILALTISVAATSDSIAETRVDITPQLGYFNTSSYALDEAGARAKFASAAGLGGRLTVWLNENVALEGSGYYMNSSLDGEYLGNPSESIDVALFYGAAQLVMGVGTEKRLLIHGGLGVQGTNYDEFIEGGNILTGVLGISGWAPLSDSVSLRVDVDAHLHTMYFEFGGIQTEELMQQDMVLSVGLQFSPGGR